MNLSDAFPSPYLSAEDLKNRPLRVTLSIVRMEEVGPDRERKPVASFSDHDKKWVLNKTNFQDLAQKFGDDTDAWQGQAIMLVAAPVQYGSKTVPGIRVQETHQNPLGVKRPAATRPAAREAAVTPDSQNNRAVAPITPEQTGQLVTLATAVWGEKAVLELNNWLGCIFTALTQEQAADKIGELQQMQPDTFADEGEPGYVPDEQRAQVLNGAAQPALPNVPAPAPQNDYGTI